jgi:hypothetical protein
VIEIPVFASCEQTLAACLRRGLVVRTDHEIARRPGSRHLHLAYPDRSGTLELSEDGGSTWFSVNERRDCGWVTAFAREVAASLEGALDAG